MPKPLTAGTPESCSFRVAVPVHAIVWSHQAEALGTPPLSARARTISLPWLGFACARTNPQILLAACTPRSRRGPRLHHPMQLLTPKERAQMRNEQLPDLHLFTGSEHWYRLSINRAVV